MTRWLVLSLALAVAFLASLLLPWAPLSGLFERDPGLASALLVELRLPRATLALVYGATLGACGAAVQALFANPLASPDLTGTTSGAALGAVVTAYLLGFAAPIALSIGAVAGALGALALLLALAGPKAETATLLLAGLAISALAGALTTLALALAPSPFAFYDAYDWLMGSLVDRSLVQTAFAAVPALLTIALLLRLALPLDRLALGEEVAQSLGHDVMRLRLQIVCLTALGGILSRPIIAAQQDLRRAHEQGLERDAVAAESTLPQTGQRHPLRLQPAGRDGAPAAAEPDRIELRRRRGCAERRDPAQQSGSRPRPSERGGDAPNARLDVGEAPGEGKVERRDAEPRGNAQPVAGAAAHVENEVGPQRRDREQAAVVAAIAPRLPPERRFGRILGEMRDRHDLIGRREREQQLVGAQIERRHPRRSRVCDHRGD